MENRIYIYYIIWKKKFIQVFRQFVIVLEVYLQNENKCFKRVCVTLTYKQRKIGPFKKKNKKKKAKKLKENKIIYLIIRASTTMRTHLDNTQL